MITALRGRGGLLTLADMKDGCELRVWNIAWGYDLGDEHAHVTTNISPFIAGEAVDYFTTDEVQGLSIASGVIWSSH